LPNSVLGVVLCVVTISSVNAASQRAKHGPANCPAGIDTLGSVPIHAVSLPPQRKCKVSLSRGLPIPDPDCTPGAVNPTLTLTILKDSNFTTKCIRDQPTSPSDKTRVYSRYGLEYPSNNFGENQTCELDHLIPLELGGAETLDNIWPQCGPENTQLENRY